MAAFLNLYAPQAVLPLLAQEFAVGPSEASMAMTACTIAVALVAPFAGAVADVIGRKRIIAAALLGLTVPTAAIGFAPDLQTLIVLRFVQGLMLPPIFAVVIAYIGEEWPPGEATGMTGIYFSASSFGGFLGRFLTGILADWLNWRSAFLIDAGLTLVCAAAVIMLLPRERRFVRASDLTAALRQMLRHLRNRQLVGTYAIGFGVLFNFIAIFTFVSFLLAGPPFLLSATFVGSIFVVYLFGSALTPLTGRAVGYFGRRNLVLGALTLWACGLLLTLLPSLPAIITGLAICAATGFLCQASSTSYVAITAKEGPSSAVGLYVTSFYIGGSVGAVMGAVAWSLAGWSAVVALVLAMLSVMAAIVALAWARAP